MARARLELNPLEPDDLHRTSLLRIDRLLMCPGSGPKILRSVMSNFAHALQPLQDLVGADRHDVVPVPEEVKPGPHDEDTKALPNL